MARPRTPRTPIDRHHAEWLSLVETSGPFLSVPALKRAMPDGLDALPDSMPELRLAHAEWLDDHGLQSRWVRFVLDEVLGLAHATHDATDADPSHRIAEHGITLRPTHVVSDAGKPVLLVHHLPPGTPLDRPLSGDGWTASPIDRAAELARASEAPLALVTNGARWTLVWARRGETTGTCTWRTEIWLEEPITLRAFVSLLGAQRFFVLPQEEGLAVLLDESAGKQQEVADRLGDQVRHAVELLIATLDREDRTRQGELLMELNSSEVYRGAVTVMMRLVFLFVAEERRLLPLDDPLYAETLAASTLRTQLRERADRFGEEVLESSRAAWHRILALFRAVHGGIEHDVLRLPAYGGGLFDPDRYPFLEGRQPGTTWDEAAAAPLPVDDRTMLHLLDALQTLRQGDVAVLLSYRSLDVEQIGHVYEGLLDHTAVRVTDAALGLIGKAEAEVTISDLERWSTDGDQALIARLGEKDVGISRAAATKALAAEASPETVSRVRALCASEPGLAERVLPLLGIVRLDLRRDPVVLLAGSLYVTQALDRRASGTYYTPRSLAEEVVQHALDPVAYEPGPAQEADPEKWQLKPSAALLDLKIADIAMGSGAFLVATCRYLAARLQEAWDAEGATAAAGTPVPTDPVERDQLAHRLVAERCLYGVDKNPMAVEMAKLSLWLVTLARDRPFSFVDHALREGDSLLGITSLQQLRAMHIDTAWHRQTSIDLAFDVVQSAVRDAATLRQELEGFVVRDVLDADRKSMLLARTDTALNDARLLASLVVGAAFAKTVNHDALSTPAVGRSVGTLLADSSRPAERATARTSLQDLRAQWLLDHTEPLATQHRPLHWPLEFPEVWQAGGFDAIVTNPPFLGNKYWKRSIGGTMQPYFERLLGEPLGRADLVAVFAWRISQLLRATGRAGFLATQSITEVDAQRLVERHVLTTARLFRATSSADWPGTAATVKFTVLWLTAGTWSASLKLDGTVVPVITAALSPVAQRAAPLRLRNGTRGFQGVDNSQGLGFLLDRNHDLSEFPCVRPYVSGSDITEGNPFTPQRFVIDLTGRASSELAELPGPVWDYLNSVVRPTRDEQTLAPYKGLADRWWTFWNPREPQRNETSTAAPECVVVPAVAKHTVALELPSSWVFTNMVFVFPRQRDDLQGTLLSTLFEIWLAEFGGTFGGGKRMKVATVTDTFPLPVKVLDEAKGYARRWQESIRAEVGDGGRSINDVLDEMHRPASVDPLASDLRDLYVELDSAVASAYCLGDLELGHDFYETKFGTRFTVSPGARLHILDRLTALNHERHAEEVRKGLHGNAKPGKGRAKPAPAGAMTLGFGDA